jgi:hypothetical protein
MIRRHPFAIYLSTVRNALVTLATEANGDVTESVGPRRPSRSNAMTVAGQLPILATGTPVEVCNRFCRSWSAGFEIVEATREGYRLRRCSDRYELPGEFSPDEIRRAI